MKNLTLKIKKWFDDVTYVWSETAHKQQERDHQYEMANIEYNGSKDEHDIYKGI